MVFNMDAIIKDGIAKKISLQKDWQILNISPDALVIVIQDGTIVYFNTQAEQLFGYSSADMLGKRIELLIPAEFRKAHVDYRNYYMDNPRSCCNVELREVIALRQDGLELPVQVHLICYQAARLIPTLTSEARIILDAGYALLSKRADQIKDEGIRQQFLQNVPYNRELLALWQAAS